MVDAVPDGEACGVGKVEPLGEALTEGGEDGERVARGDRDASGEELELGEKVAAPVAGADEVGALLALPAFECVGDADTDAQPLVESDIAPLELIRADSVARKLATELPVAETQPESTALEEVVLLAPMLGVGTALEAEDVEGESVACAGVCVPELDGRAEVLIAIEGVAVIDPNAAVSVVAEEGVADAAADDEAAPVAVSTAVADSKAELGDAPSVELELPPSLLLGSEDIVCVAEKVRNGDAVFVAASEAVLDALPPAAVPDSRRDSAAVCDTVAVR